MEFLRNRQGKVFGTAIASICLFLGIASTSLAMDFTVAGAPKDRVANRNYQSLFQTLKQNGIGFFFPTFQYQEVPMARSYGYESDFVAPCTKSSAAFSALRNSGVSLVLPAELVYPDPSRIGSVSIKNDPLSQLIACAGRDKIAAITNYDEAVMQGVSFQSVQKLYQRVKEIDASLPVWMVHGPIITDRSEFQSNSKINSYLNKVVSFSQYSDVVGFDVYPVPESISLVATPLSNGEVVRESEAIAEYTLWLKNTFPEKDRLIVLQGFSYPDFYEPNYLRATVSNELLEQIHPPSRAQIDMMVKQAQDNGIKMVVWWGQAALKTSDQAPWPYILEMGRKY